MNEPDIMRTLPPPYFHILMNQGEQAGPYMFTCEHATDNFGPQPVEAANVDLLGTHWAVDLGAAALTRALARTTNSIAILSAYSRLLLDSNRCLTSSTLFVETVETEVLKCNQSLTEEERLYRIDCLHTGYHTGIDKTLSKRVPEGPCLLVSMHSFTPVWKGHQRGVEIGVLFDDHDALAHDVIDALSTQGFEARANKPYSGRSGELMYAATLHGAKHQIPYIEFEVRQDLIATPEGLNRITQAIKTALASATQNLSSVG